ncbi:MAG: acyltransferase family protein [Erythrobacter sp.]
MAAGPDKVIAIQLLRFIAALIVAVLHMAFAFADHIGGGLGIGPGDGRIGQAAVMLFFVISGYVMVVSSRGLFGRPGARGQFWRRRIIRIMPPYWLATAFLALVFVTIFPQPIDPRKLAQSLVLIPYWPDGDSLRAVPVLWVGWTLFFEMMFYFWFGLFITRRRREAVGAVMIVLTALVIGGLWVPPDNAFAFTLTRSVSLMFIAGMALAGWREAGGSAPAALRWLAALAIAPIAWLVPAPVQESAMGFDYLAWCALPAAMLAFALLSGPLDLPLPRLVNGAGDISYALYLLHLPVAWLWLWVWPKIIRRVPLAEIGPWNYAVSAVLAAVAAAWLFFTFIERPMTQALNRRWAAPHSNHA